MSSRFVFLIFGCFFSFNILAQDFSEEVLKQADAISGEQTWQQYCAFCHTLRKGQANMAGPNLHELFKRKVGSKSDFSYSLAFKNADAEWTPEFFSRYVQNPSDVLPGNLMPAVDIPEEKVTALLAYVMRMSESVDWDKPQQTVIAAGGLDGELQTKEPEFWQQYMDNTIKFTLPRENGETYSFVAYFNPDGTITGNNRGLQGIWRMRDKRNFCYSIERVGVHPFEWMHCIQPKADSNLEFGQFIKSFSPVKGHEEFEIDISFLEGRPHPLEGDAHPDYWTFLFNNTSRYEIKVNKETVIVDARFNEDKTISSPQGISGIWRTEGEGVKKDRMCYYLNDVPGINGRLSECFALVLMFNPRVGARWPARFDQGNSYWAEIIEGRN
ncbi:MAG: c-type cytochrome [Pseudomonadota bacterium]|nr:c-type cytochrome [Pseudomonadota bacterium]